MTDDADDTVRAVAITGMINALYRMKRQYDAGELTAKEYIAKVEHWIDAEIQAKRTR